MVEANFSGDEKYVAPVSTKWSKNILTTVDTKGNILLKCTLFWPKNDEDAHRLMLKHTEPDPNDTNNWLSPEDNVTIFRFCGKRKVLFWLEKILFCVSHE